MKKAIASCALVLLASCVPATSFKGEAHFPGGARGCFDRCQQAGMVMDSYVYVGEYSSACVCRPLGPMGQGPSPGASPVAVAAVMTQMRAAEQQRRAMINQQPYTVPYAPQR